MTLPPALQKVELFPRPKRPTPPRRYDRHRSIRYVHGGERRHRRVSYRFNDRRIPTSHESRSQGSREQENCLSLHDNHLWRKPDQILQQTTPQTKSRFTLPRAHYARAPLEPRGSET